MNNIKECCKGITQESQWRNTAKQEEKKKRLHKRKKGILKTRTNGTVTSKRNE